MKYFVFIGFFLGLISCGDSNDGDDQMVGPCVVNFEDPLITFQSASEEITGYKISQVYISNITKNGGAVDLSETQGDVISNLILDADGLGGYCTFPCSALVEEGDYSIQLRANGYEEKILNFTAEYGSFEGGCPAYYREGIVLNVNLTPQS